MFANTFQSGFISIFYSVGSSPLSIWEKQVKNGHIRRVIDEEVKSLVLEISGTNVATTFITTPIMTRASLAIRLPFLVMIIKNMKKYFTFEIQILDDKDMKRRFRVSNFQSSTKVRPFCTTMPIGLSAGWNQIQFNLADFTRRAYGTLYIETVRVQVHANARIRRIYFADKLYSEDEMPSEYKLFIPLTAQKELKGKTSAAKQAKPKPGEAEAEDEKLRRRTSAQAEPSAAPPSPVGPEGQEEILTTLVDLERESSKTIEIETEIVGEGGAAVEIEPAAEAEQEFEAPQEEAGAAEGPPTEGEQPGEPETAQEQPPDEQQPADEVPTEQVPEEAGKAEEQPSDVVTEAPPTEEVTAGEDQVNKVPSGNVETVVSEEPQNPEEGDVGVE